MICRLTGRIVAATDSAVAVEVGGVCHEVLAPACSLPDLQRLSGNEVTLFTLEYLEGNPTVGNLIPRMVGFLSETERAFFHEFIKVRGVSMRRALRAMAIPPHQLAAAIERGDDKTLASLPEIGKKTAAQMITDLRGKLQRFLTPEAAPLPLQEMSGAQKVALEILVQWGDRRADAQRWIAAAVEAEPALTEPGAIVRAAYRKKSER